MQFVRLWDNAGQAPAGWASHIMLRWFEWEPQPDQYDYARVERALAAANRPCYLQLGFSMYNKSVQAPEDYTPAHHRRSIALTAASGVTGCVPDYSAAWVDALCQATVALAQRFKGHPQVRGFWPPLGWDQECQAAVNNAGGEWGTLLKGKLAEQTYLDFLLRYSRTSRDAWRPLPVYLPAAPSPGGVWGHRRRDVIATLLDEGCGYMNCGLMPDFPTSYGVGGHAGTGMHDIAIGRTARVGYEEGPRKAYDDPGELYWMLLRVWDRSDFVALYNSLSGPQVAVVLPKLPATKRWLVWRASEYSPVTFRGADGQLYGTQGEPGCWGVGLRWRTGGQLRLDATRYDDGRWQLVSAPDEPAGGAIEMEAPGLADGRYRMIVYTPPNGQQELTVTVQAERFSLPAGTYHRVDVIEPALKADPLPNDERAPSAEKVRWWLEELKRVWDAGQTARAQAILVSLIDLAYRLEGKQGPPRSLTARLRELMARVRGNGADAD